MKLDEIDARYTLNVSESMYGTSCPARLAHAGQYSETV